MSKHTQTDWVISRPVNSDILIRAGHKGFVIAEVTNSISHFIGNEIEAEANAKLISAAPNLLSALKEALEEMKQINNKYPERVMYRIQAAENAINKATI